MSPEVVAAMRLRDDMSAPLAAATKHASNGFGLLGGLIAGPVGLVATLGSAIAAFGIAAVQHTTDAGQAAYQMGQQFGLGGEQASEWMTVARHLGIDSDQLGSGFKFLAKNVENLNLSLQEHGKLTAAEVQPYKDLGLSVFDAAGKMKSSNELMFESADAFRAMPDGIEKTGLAIKLFGKQGMEMLPVLNQGRTALEATMKTGRLTGEVMSGPQVEAAHKMFLAQQKLSSQFAGFTTMLGTALMPIAAEFMGWVTEVAAPRFAALARPVIDLLQRTGALRFELAYLNGLLQFALRTSVIGLVIQIAKLNSTMGASVTPVERLSAIMQGVFGMSPATANATGVALVRLSATIAKGIAPILRTLAMIWRDNLLTALRQVAARMPAIEAHFAVLMEKERPLLALVMRLWDIELRALGYVLKVVMPPAINLVLGVWDTVMTALGVVMDTFMALWTLLDDLFHGRWGRLWADVVNLFATAVGGIFSIVGSVARIATTFFGDLADNIIGTKGSIPMAWAGLVSWLQAVPQNLLVAIGTVDKMLVQVGRDMVQGLINGIAAKWSDLIAWIAYQVASLPQGLMDQLGISSPSKVMRKVGSDFVANIKPSKALMAPARPSSPMPMETRRLFRELVAAWTAEPTALTDTEAQLSKALRNAGVRRVGGQVVPQPI